MLDAGGEAPDFALPDRDGHDVRLADFEHRPVVVYFSEGRSPRGARRRLAASASTPISSFFDAGGKFFSDVADVHWGAITTPAGAADAAIGYYVVAARTIPAPGVLVY